MVYTLNYFVFNFININKLNTVHNMLKLLASVGLVIVKSLTSYLIIQKKIYI